jgi:hypothetical protein
MLGFVAISPDTVGIYTLPTVHEALRFSKSRIDPVIRGSKYLSSIIVNGNDSSSFKQLGTSQIFMAGTFGKALISIPTDILLCDEVDFSNPEVLVTAESRLSHSRLTNDELDIRGIRRKFSTPTLPQMGISALFEKSDQRPVWLSASTVGIGFGLTSCIMWLSPVMTETWLKSHILTFWAWMNVDLQKRPSFMRSLPRRDYQRKLRAGVSRVGCGIPACQASAWLFSVAI